MLLTILAAAATGLASAPAAPAPTDMNSFRDQADAGNCETASLYPGASNGTGIVIPCLTTLSATFVVNRLTFGLSATMRAISPS